MLMMIAITPAERTFPQMIVYSNQIKRISFAKHVWINSDLIVFDVFIERSHLNPRHGSVDMSPLNTSKNSISIHIIAAIYPFIIYSEPLSRFHTEMNSRKQNASVISIWKLRFVI